MLAFAPQVLEAQATKAMETMLAELRAGAGRLHQVAGGGVAGALWHDGQRPGERILDVYKHTLACADKGQIELLLKTLEKATGAQLHSRTSVGLLHACTYFEQRMQWRVTWQAIGDAESECKAYMYVLSNWSAFRDLDGPTLLKQAKAAVARACTTKAEALLCQVLERGKDSKKTVDRTLSITADLSSRTHADWRQMVHGDLVASYDEVLGKHKS